MAAFWHAKEPVKGGNRFLQRTNYVNASLVMEAIEKIIVIVFKLRSNDG